MTSGQQPVKQNQMARELGLSPATVSRIVKTLALEGYVQMTSEKYCVCNFRLSRNVPMSDHYLNRLSQLMQEISHQHGVSVEAVVVAGFDLFWHSCTEFPDASIAIKAKPGFRRTLTELDPLSRLYLSRISWDTINEALLPGGFFRNDIERGIVGADEAKEIIESAAGKLVDCDFDGNHMGVRRFVTVVEDENGQFMHLLSIAEAALPVPDKASHISKFTAVLTEARETLKLQMKKTADVSIDKFSDVTRRERPLQQVG